MKVLLLAWQPPLPVVNGPRHHSLGVIKACLALGQCDVIAVADTRQVQAEWGQCRLAFPDAQIHVYRNRIGIRKFIRPLWISRAVIRRTLPSIEARHNRRIQEYVNKATASQKYDVVVVDGLQWLAGDYGFDDAVRILVPHDAYSLDRLRNVKWARSWRLRVRYRLDYWFHRRLEQTWHPTFDVVAPVSRIDARYLVRRGLSGVNVTPVGIPIQSGLQETDSPSAVSERLSRLRIGICGWLGSEAIVSAVHELVRYLGTTHGLQSQTAQLVVWSSEPAPPRLQKLLKSMGVESVGWVPDYEEFLKRLDIYVYPQRTGAGLQTKVMEAMALGIPVVAARETLTPLGARNFLDAIVASTPVVMAKAIRYLIENERQRRLIGSAGATLIRDRFGQEATSRALAALVRAAQARKSS